jgi:hypothetical protein
VESYRILVVHADIDGIPVEFDYGDVFVVVREGLDEPAPTDWEAQLRTDQFHRLAMARHDLALTVADGTCLRGAAIVRFTDGHRHLFRGDATLEGFERHGLTEPPESG